MRKSSADQRDLAKAIGVSSRTAKAVFKGLVDGKLADCSGTVLASGLRALRPYKVDNAIIMAAGVSSRLAPLSYEKPKGLLTVKGEVLVERQIRQLHEAGIDDITVVVGYMKEKFLYLQDKFGVDVVVNGDYCRYNNTSTLIRVLSKLRNTFICSSDNYFTENVFEPYVYDSYYAASYFPGKTDEWGIRTNRCGRITGIDHSPAGMWCMMGHVYFSRGFSRAFGRILREEYGRESTRHELWESVLERNLRRLDMNIRKYPHGVVLEFDSLRDLRAFDHDFMRNCGSNLARLTADRRRAEKVVKGLFGARIEMFERLGGLTNRSYKTTLDTGRTVVVRIPGEGTSAIINREDERVSTELGCRCGVDARLHYFGKDGVKVMDYIDGAVTMNAGLLRKPKNIRAVAKVFRTLHGSGCDTRVRFEIFKMADQYRRVIAEGGVPLYPDFARVTERVSAIKSQVDRDCRIRTVPCHNDSLCENWILDARGKMYLIDWEYAGMNDAMWDLADVSIEAGYSAANDAMLLRAYLGRSPTANERRNFLANKIYLDYLWTLWGKTRVPYDGQAMEDYALARYERLKRNIRAYKEGGNS